MSDHPILGYSPTPWFYDGYSGIHSGPLTQEYANAEDLLPRDAPDSAYENLPDPFVARVESVEHGDLGTKRGEANARLIVDAVNWYVTTVLTAPVSQTHSESSETP